MQEIAQSESRGNLLAMPNQSDADEVSYLSMDGLYINDFHRSNSMAAQREVQRMSLHPYSREQMLQQIAEFQKDSASKKNAKPEGEPNTK